MRSQLRSIRNAGSVRFSRELILFPQTRREPLAQYVSKISKTQSEMLIVWMERGCKIRFPDASNDVDGFRL